MKDATIRQIEALVDESDGFTDDWKIRRWSSKVTQFLQTTLGEDQAEEFLNLDGGDEWDQFAMRQGLLQGIVAKAKDESVHEGDAKPASSDLQHLPSTAEPGGTRKIFVVHGHDEAAKEATARFLEKLDLQPVILHEQASGGRTIIEKFEKYSKDVRFAVVLLTPDDLGATHTESEKMQPRARQNVVLELGYFLGRLTRNRVCALHKGGVELPSDIQGVIYVEMDDAGAWKTKIAQELVQAKYPINLEALVSG